VPKKYRIPAGTILPAGGYAKFDETKFNTGSAAFALSGLGDDAYLFAADATTNLTGYAHGATFGASENGVSFGRYVNSLGAEDFVAMSWLTLGTNNARSLIGPVVISEVMYQPAAGAEDSSHSEFIELQNVTATNVLLYATDFPENTWRLGNAVDYQFPTEVSLPPEGRLVVVGFDPATNGAALASFRAAYGALEGVPLYGPWSGRLNNSGESVELKFPDQPELDGSVPYVLVEKVAYRPAAPWPASAAGTGFSLQRGMLLAYANDPANWFAAAPTPGALASQTSQDLDGDGVPDTWEIGHGTDPHVADGAADVDGDGYSNLQEWQAGTDPQDAGSCLRFESIEAGAGSVTLRFRAMEGRSYSLLGASTPDPVLWLKVQDIPAGTNRLVEVTQPVSETRFYRLAAP